MTRRCNKKKIKKKDRVVPPYGRKWFELRNDGYTSMAKFKESTSRMPLVAKNYYSSAYANGRTTLSPVREHSYAQRIENGW